jgi:uncharacterized surface protein with fasciclin (FAS1) repeats
MRTIVKPRILTVIVAGLLLFGGTHAAFSATVADVLESNPQFSNYVGVIKATGLWPVLRRQQAITVFAPTNAAFDQLDRNWRNILLPQTGGEGTGVGNAMDNRQTMVKRTAVGGSHPQAEFQGKVTKVKSAGGSIFVVDGTKSGNLVINPQGDMETSIGFPSKEGATVTAGSPIAADNGFVYPTDGFTFD